MKITHNIKLAIYKLVGKVKRDSKFSIDQEISLVDLTIILFTRTLQCLRGCLSKLHIDTKGFFFRGRRVVFKHTRYFKAGRNLIIGDFSFINALSTEGVILGDNVTIERMSTIICTAVIRNKGKGVKIGNNTGINQGAYIAGQGGVTIGDYVIIGPGVKIFSEDHQFSGEDYIKNQGEKREKVIIGNNCWIGSNVTILAGVKLGEKTIVAAGAVVNNSFSGNCIIGGVPAKVIKNL
jgi:acetyltransferase-like isoleucine patch superfamily enzyme